MVNFLGEVFNCRMAGSEGKAMSGDVETRLAALGLSLPEPAKPVASYIPSCVHQNLLFISGQLPFRAGGELVRGRLGESLDVSEGQQAARLAALQILAQAKAAVVDFTRIVRCLRLTGYVNATPDFTEHPAVINGASVLMVDALGDLGRHSRVAVGVAGLPLGAAVEVDAVFAIA
jgi:enamine deaminase RidA (YjgF/YER057c/UK114 family)